MIAINLKSKWASLDFLGLAAILFLSVNVANVANLLFNMLFARLMTPAQFADLTLLLTVKLGILSLFTAIQFAVSEIAASQPNDAAAKTFAARLSRASFKYALPLCCLVLICVESLCQTFNLADWKAIAILCAAIPLFLPMVIYRGLAQGRIDVKKMVGSVQSEWIIRLAGCWILYQAGFGLPGIAVALVLSIIAAFVFALDKDDVACLVAPKPAMGIEHRSLLLTSLPYGILCLAQIIALDSDILIAKAIFDSDAAGIAAGIMLIQRIFFFAFLSFAMILQPIVSARTDAAHQFKSLWVLLSCVAFISVMGLGVMAVMPHLFVTIFLGAQYSAAGTYVVLAGCIGASFTIAHLCTVFLIAKGRPFAPLLLLTFVTLHICANLTAFNTIADYSLGEYLSIKAVIVGIGALSVASYTFWDALRMKRRA